LHGNDSPGLDKHRKPCDGTIDGNFTIALVACAVVQIIPFALRQEYARKVAGAFYGTYQQIGTEEIFVVITAVVHARIEGIVDREGTLNGHTGFRSLVKDRIQIGHQLVSEPDVVAGDLLDLFAVRPRLGVAAIDHGVPAKEWCERSD